MKKNKKKIYICYTGGTIGMVRSPNGYVPAKNYMHEQLLKIPELHRDEMPSFTLNEYEPLIDSSNMNPNDWVRIANDIYKNYEMYDGFVILHGTDTMAYTSSALSFIFENLNKPIIVTGSQIPLCEIRSDAHNNLLTSLFLAANYPVNEVSLFFNNKLLRGNRAKKIHADGFDAFESPNLPPLIHAGINIKVNKSLIDLPKKRNVPVKINTLYTQPIGVVTFYPGISTQVIKNTILQPVKALIIQTFGVGNAPQEPSFIQLLKEANENKILILNITQCLSGKVNMDGYATGKELQNVGVTSGYDITLEAALTKLHLILSLPISFDERKMLLAQNLKGEITY
ncbi:asparaginase [Paraphotobacterium marinum]|uniref:asparaginase n=1 Tax=Paraphotobacterium marinum TaxID=1755811 RepID=UPI0039E73DF5